jgi:hypothetical protein
LFYWVLKPRLPTKIVDDSPEPESPPLDCPPNYYLPPKSPPSLGGGPPLENLRFKALPSKSYPFSAAIAFLASEFLENCKKAMPEGLPFFCGILMLVIVPYFLNLFLSAFSSLE